MSAILAALVAAAVAQAPVSTPPSQATQDAVEAARRAADAAEKAAEAAERSAKAAEELVRRGVPEKPAEAAAPVPKAPAPKKWNTAVGLSLIAMTGNSETLTFSLTGTAERRTGHWVLSAKATAAYGQSRLEGTAESQVVAEAASAQARVDRKLTEKAAAFLVGAFDTDHVKSVEARYGGQIGAAITWWERKEGEADLAHLRTDLGIRGAYEARFQYFPTPADQPDVTLIAPTLGIGFRYSLGPTVTFIEEAEISANIWGESRLLATSLSRLSMKLVAGLSASVALQVNHDSFPAPGKKTTDTVLSVGLDLTF